MPAKKKKEQTLLNTSKLAYRFGLIRDTVRRRLEVAGVKPVKRDPKHGTLYDLDEATPFLETDEDISELKKRKLKAEAEEKEMKVQERKGDLLTAAEVKEVFQKIVSGLYREMKIAVPRRLAPTLAKAKNQKQVNKILKDDVQLVFDRFRDDFTEFLK